MYLKKGEKKKFFSIYFLLRHRINLVLKSKICKNRTTKICLKVKRLKDFRKEIMAYLKYLLNKKVRKNEKGKKRK